MMNMPLLEDIIIIFGLSVIVLFVCHRIHVPTIVGFLLTGILAGPHGLKLVTAVHEVEILAEIGIVLLLFAVGIEFSFKGLLQLKKSVWIGGPLQVMLTVVATVLIMSVVGVGGRESLFIGFLLALSSTTIVLRLLQERAEMHSPQGQATLGILIFQDLIVVPMMIVTPLLAPVGAQHAVPLPQTAIFPAGGIFALLLKGIAVVALIIVGAKWVVPRALYHIARTRSRELFLLSIVVICLSVAWMTSRVGLSLALGAFLAGLIISESEYGHHAFANIVPFRDVFTSFFFVSIGMLLDTGIIVQRPLLIVGLVCGVLVLKSLIAGGASLLLGYALRTSVLVGLALSQIGEFSFVLSRAGLHYAALSQEHYQIFLNVTVLTMAVTPFLIAMAPRTAQVISGLPVAERFRLGHEAREMTSERGISDHLVIIGFGVNGRNVARASRAAGIPYVIAELNPDTVRSEKAKGEAIFYGDATHEAVLQRLGVERARIVVVAISDPVATRRIVEIIRRLNPRVHVIARTRFVQEVESLYRLGADEVIPEEFETSVEIFTRVLNEYLIPSEEIEKFVAEIRTDAYEMFRSRGKDSAAVCDLRKHIPEIEVSTFRVGASAPVVGKTLLEIDLRRQHKVSVVAIRREGAMIANPHGETRLQAGDLVVVLGGADTIADVARLFKNPDPDRIGAGGSPPVQ